MYAGGKDTERVEDGPDSADMEGERGQSTHDPRKYRGITLLSQVLKLLERVLDAMIRRRVEGDFGEEQQGFRKGRGTAGGMYLLRQNGIEDTGGTGQYGSGVRRPGESF